MSSEVSTTMGQFAGLLPERAKSRNWLTAITGAVATAELAYVTWKRVRDWREANRTNTIVFPADGSGYDLLVSRISDSLEQSNVSSRVARIGRKGEPNQFLFGSGPRRSFKWNGVSIPFEVKSTGRKPSAGFVFPDDYEMPGPGPIVFYITSAAQESAILDLLEEIRLEMMGEPALWFREWSSWSIARSSNHRPLNTIWMDGDIIEDICSDIKTFLDSGEKYERLGIPWHRGYMLYGEPGTGKTSLVSGIADELGMDIYTMSFGSITEDTLAGLFNSVSSESILLIEDIDVQGARVDRESTEGKVPLSTLLNYLDGLQTPSGLIVMMTTNRLDSIDPAVIRPGRVDRTFYIGYLTQNQLDKMWASLHGGSAPQLPEGVNVLPAEVIEVFKSNLNDTTPVYDEVVNLFERKASDGKGTA